MDLRISGERGEAVVDAAKIGLGRWVLLIAEMIDEVWGIIEFTNDYEGEVLSNISFCE